MGDPDGVLRLIRIDKIETVGSELSLVSSSNPDDHFEKIVIFEGVARELVQDEGEELVGDLLFVEIYRVTTHTGEHLARARPYEYRIFGSIPAGNSHHEKVAPAKFKQGSKVAKVNGGELQTRSKALITGRGTVNITINIEQETFSADISGYETDLPSIGDVVEASIPSRNNRSKAVILTEDGHYTIKLEKTPLFAGDVEVEITEDTHPIRGRVVGYGEGIPSPGEIIETSINRLNKSVPIEQYDMNFNVELENVPITTGDVSIRITGVEQSVTGEIVRYSNLPEKGDIITASGKRQSKNAELSPDGEQYKIRVDGGLLIDGEVDVLLTSDGPPFQGTIESYRGNLPEEGDEVSASIVRTPAGVFAEPDILTYRILIEDETDYSGPAIVRVTDVSHEQILGEIVKETPTKRRQASENKNPFGQDTGKNIDLINRDKL